MNPAQLFYVLFPPKVYSIEFCWCFYFGSMNWRLFFLLVIVINTSVSINRFPDLPCHFLDSVNITAGALQYDSSIIFDNVIYTEYAHIAYTLENGSIKHPTKPYTRGCIPKNKTSFIRLYCPFGLAYQDCPSYRNIQNLKQDIVKNNETILTSNHTFGYLFDQPCSNYYEEEEKYTILPVRFSEFKKKNYLMLLNIFFFSKQFHILFLNIKLDWRYTYIISR